MRLLVFLIFASIVVIVVPKVHYRKPLTPPPPQKPLPLIRYWNFQSIGLPEQRIAKETLLLGSGIKEVVERNKD